MQKVTITRPETKIIGIEARTNNEKEFSGTGVIGAQWQKFYEEGIGNKIPNQVNPSEVLGIYTSYASDANGDYTYIIGKEVSSLESVPEGLVAITLPATKYSVFTSNKGPMPNIVIELWQHIWSPESLVPNHERAYLADFEIYDARCADPTNAQVDLYVSTK